MSDVFIDGGGGDRIYLEKYLNKLPVFDKVYVFEPNPSFYDSYDGSSLALVQKAIWTSNCTLPFYLSKDEWQVGSSLLREKLCRREDRQLHSDPDWHDMPIEVECVDFSGWIVENIKPHQNLTLKLDIEGAEYEVLWKMINDGTISFVKKLYVEFHKDHLKVKDVDHNRLVKRLEGLGVVPNDWD